MGVWKTGNSRSTLVTAVVAFVGAVVVAALLRFNQSATSYNQYLIGNLIGLFWVPMLTILFVFREDPDRFGFTLGSWRRLWFVLLFLFAGVVVLMIFASRLPKFQAYYPLFRHYPEFFSAFGGYPAQSPFVREPMLMLYAEASYGMYMFCWEFFFRGYLLFGLQRCIGWAAVIVQALAFGILHYGKPAPEIAASFGAGAILGIIALNAKSFVPCFVLHWAASITFDILVVCSRSA